MATYEERLRALEQTHVQSSEAISDLNHHVTMLIGIMSKQEWDIREMKSSLRAIDSRLGSLEQSVDSRFERLETTLGEHTSLLTQILARLPEKS